MAERARKAFSLKMPKEPAERAAKKAQRGARDLYAVVREQLFTAVATRTELIRRPRAAYGSGGHPSVASVTFSQQEYDLFYEFKAWHEEAYDWTPTWDDLGWTAVQNYLQEEEWELNERVIARAQADGERLKLLMRGGLLLFMAGKLTVRRLPADMVGWQPPADAPLSHREWELLDRARDKSRKKLGFRPTLSDLLYSYLTFHYLEDLADDE